MSGWAKRAPLGLFLTQSLTLSDHYTMLMISLSLPYLRDVSAAYTGDRVASYRCLGEIEYSL